MKKIILSLLFISIILTGTYLFYDKVNKSEKENLKTFLDLKNFETNTRSKYLKPKDLDPKSFIALFTENYNKNSQLNFVILVGDFPDNWVKPNDVQYLISVMRSKKNVADI